MYKKFFFIIIFLLISSIISAYTLPYSIKSNLYNAVSDSEYKLNISEIGNVIEGNKNTNNNYKLYSGFLYYMDSYFEPAYFKILNTKTHICKKNILSNDSMIFGIFDFDSSPVQDILLKLDVLDSPANSEGMNIINNKSDSSGKIYSYFTGGSKTGSYILKASYPELGSEYISYHTDEFDIKAKEWYMIGVNKIPEYEEKENCFNGIIPEYIVHWNPENLENQIYKKYEQVTKIKNGLGYFIILPEDKELKLTGKYFEDTFIIDLKKGWNQLANPYYYIKNWLSSKIIIENNSVLTVSEAAEQGYIKKEIFWYKDNSYFWGPNDDIAQPNLYVWTGFWLEALKDCKLMLSPEFEYIEKTRTNLAPKRTINSENWKIRVSAIGNKNSDKFNYFGVNENSNDMIDTLDVKKAPGLEDFISINFSDENNLCNDIKKGPIETAVDWSLSVNSGNNTLVSLKFFGLENVPSYYDVYLIENVGLKYYDLKKEKEFFFSTPENTAKKFRVIAGKPEYVQQYIIPPLSKQYTFVKPNPGPSVNGEITFVYGGIPNKGTLNLTIYDLAGIRVLKKTLDTSSSEYVWNCKNGAGKKIKTGVYIYILEYKGTDKSYKLVDKFAIVR